MYKSEKYLYYILPKLDYNTNRATKGATLNKDSVENLEIPFNEEYIEALVKKLDKIENDRQTVINAKEKLETKRDTLILSDALS